MLSRRRNAVTSPPGYYIEKELDKGAFGTVFKAFNLKTGTKCALKAIGIPNIRPVYKESIKAAWRDEVETLMKASVHR